MKLEWKRAFSISFMNRGVLENKHVIKNKLLRKFLFDFSTFSKLMILIAKKITHSTSLYFCLTCIPEVCRKQLRLILAMVRHHYLKKKKRRGGCEIVISLLVNFTTIFRYTLWCKIKCIR